MCVQLSWDAGVTWTAARSTPTLTTSMATYVLGGSADTWGRTWTSAELSDASFRVRVANVGDRWGARPSRLRPLSLSTRAAVALGETCRPHSPPRVSSEVGCVTDPASAGVAAVTTATRNLSAPVGKGGAIASSCLASPAAVRLCHPRPQSGRNPGPEHRAAVRRENPVAHGTSSTKLFPQLLPAL
jgi:hypothetical protein